MRLGQRQGGGKDPTILEQKLTAWRYGWRSYKTIKSKRYPYQSSTKAQRKAVRL